MVLNATEAAAKYESGVKIIGGTAAYRQCGSQKKVGKIAECMHGLKAKLTESDWAKKYAAAY